MLSIVHIDMEGFVDTAKEILHKLWETIKGLIAKIKSFTIKYLGVAKETTMKFKTKCTDLISDMKVSYALWEYNNEIKRGS